VDRIANKEKAIVSNMKKGKLNELPFSKKA
jgi:hypothetical protein